MKILLCVTASVSIYKTFEVIRLLTKKGCVVRVVLSNSASKMVSHTLFEALGCEVFLKDTGKMEHISLTRWADALLLCPATASTIGKIANGIGGSLLLDVFLAKPAYLRTIIAPAMNVEMWNNVFVEENLSRLQKNHFEIITPESGELACGEIGMGKLASIEEITNCVLDNIGKKLNIVITAGGTIERFDDVRCLTNFSSGRQALEIVKAFVGYNVTVILARADVEFPAWCRIVKVESAKEMLVSSIENANNCDVFIACAAVADFTFERKTGKVKKNEITNLELIPNPDVLKTVANLKERPKCVVGFAAESENVLQNATGKLNGKNCDFVVGNGLCFGKSETSGFIVEKNDSEEFACSKHELAKKIKLKVLNFLQGR